MLFVIGYTAYDNCKLLGLPLLFCPLYSEVVSGNEISSEMPSSLLVVMLPVLIVSLRSAACLSLPLLFSVWLPDSVPVLV